MEFAFSFIYALCIALHFGAFYFARKVWHAREEEYSFDGGGIKRFLKSRREREFAIIAVGGCINILYGIVLGLYVYIYNAHATGWLEVLFCLIHLLSSFWTLAVHLHCWIEESIRHDEHTAA